MGFAPFLTLLFITFVLHASVSTHPVLFRGVLDAQVALMRGALAALSRGVGCLQG
ncbi:hypothetical protein AURDEDRAFT_116472 [Auricularia subglabra TFB-10046 SS5]|nr:hypothetical protein AURDEDRAFT_116472 [Auricularia subglabra TFB-10046 SS5]